MEDEMKKLMFILVAMAFIAFGYTAGAYAAEMERPMGKEAGDVSGWVGKEVKNPQGEKLGKVDDFVRDKRGNVSLVIISHGGVMGVRDKKVAVPYNALSFNESKGHAVLAATKEQLANAPAIDNQDVTDPAFAREVDRYFGDRARWEDKKKETRGYYGPDRGYYGSDGPYDTRTRDVLPDRSPWGYY